MIQPDFYREVEVFKESQTYFPNYGFTNHFLHSPQKILIVSDAWLPQVNGVVRTLAHVKAELENQGRQVKVIGPELFSSIKCPTYHEIRLAVDCVTKLSMYISQFQPDAIHIATEGPLGWTARHLCTKWKIPFTTAFHTKFPEYVKARLPIPLKFSYAVLKRFHSFAKATLVTTPSIKDELENYGFKNLRLWSRGVEPRIFRPQARNYFERMKLPSPIHLYVGRVAIEKNLEDFLKLDLDGSKVIVGDGPAFEELQKRFPEAHFLGVKKGNELGEIYSSADVFVFPSRSDTFGVVMIEALACGLPVAAYPVTGPKDILNSQVGAMNEDLKLAIQQARKLSRKDCAQYGGSFTWKKCSQILLDTLAAFDKDWK